MKDKLKLSEIVNRILRDKTNTKTKFKYNWDKFPMLCTVEAAEKKSILRRSLQLGR